MIGWPLPAELTDLVISLVQDKRDLVRLALVRKSWVYASRKAAFAHADFAILDTESTPGKQRAFIALIQGSQCTFKQHMKRVTLTLGVNTLPEGSSQEYAELWDDVCLAMVGCGVQIKELDISWMLNDAPLPGEVTTLVAYAVASRGLDCLRMACGLFHLMCVDPECLDPDEDASLAARLGLDNVNATNSVRIYIDVAAHTYPELQVLRNFLDSSAVCLARLQGLELTVVDLGIQEAWEALSELVSSPKSASRLTTLKVMVAPPMFLDLQHATNLTSLKYDIPGLLGSDSIRPALETIATIPPSPALKVALVIHTDEWVDSTTMDNLIDEHAGHDWPQAGGIAVDIHGLSSSVGPDGDFARCMARSAMDGPFRFEYHSFHVPSFSFSSAGGESDDWGGFAIALPPGLEQFAANVHSSTPPGA